MSYRILIVDDSKLARMFVAKALRSLHPGWSLVEAANAEEALQLLRAGPVDIALLDFNMPGRDGLTLAADMRTSHPSLPVAVVSANVQDEVISRARAIGATFIPKPLTEETLGHFLSAAVMRLKTPAA